MKLHASSMVSLLVALMVAAGCGSGGSSATDGGGPGATDDAGPGATDGAAQPDGSSPDGSRPDGSSPRPDTGAPDGGACEPTAEMCSGADDDCDGAVDEELAGQACALTEGVCVGAVASCGGAAGWLACDAAAYGSDYEVDETRCDGLDNDCDGTTDEGCPCTPGETQPCGSDEGECAAGTQACLDDLTWSACEGEAGPMGESCDGLDNDCDGDTDDAMDLTPPSCDLQSGVCAGAVRECMGADGWSDCDGSSYGADYEETETRCDGLDNDCDGAEDESCGCEEGASQACGSSTGACEEGTQMCSSGAWGSCTGGVEPATEQCNGVDDNCNGETDEDLEGPACPLTGGVCAGATQRCGGAGGFLACEASDYGPRYEEDETLCDGFDNDCDGAIDEDCECVDGATQDCGSSTGACERGTQTCAGGTWGDCVGGVGPEDEECNGADDDCDGVTDNNLISPACTLGEGVCEGTVQVCGGTSGWLACGARSYGPSYHEVEDGAVESHCDGLDNDCDGDVDEGCASGPILADTGDLVAPVIFDQHVAFLGSLDGNWDLFLLDLRTDEVFRLTETPENEGDPHVYGQVIAYTRGEGADMRVVMFDLDSLTETVLTEAESGSPVVWRNLIAYDDRRNGTDWNIMLYDISDGAEYSVTSGSSNDIRPDMRGNRIVYISGETGTFTTRLFDLADLSDTPQTDAAAGDHLDPQVDFAVVGWSDGRDVSDPSDILDDWQVFGADTATLGTEILFAGAAGSQILGDIDSLVLGWSDRRNGNWDIAVSGFSDSPETLFVTTSDAAQVAPRLSGNVIVWQDNRLGTFDIYASQYPAVAAGPDDILINELLADPAPGEAGDANGDGTRDGEDDELVELVNVSLNVLDISGFVLSDGNGTRHVFPPGSTLPSGGTLVVFGGGSPTGWFGGAKVQTASTGALGLNNDGDTVSIVSPGGELIGSVTYGTEGQNDTSLVRSSEYDGTSSLVLHDAAAGSGGRLFSPGTLRQGFAF